MIVASDGDYAPLIKVLIEKNSMEIVLSPAPVESCSVLLKRTGAKIAFIGEQKNILELKNSKEA